MAQHVYFYCHIVTGDPPVKTLPLGPAAVPMHPKEQHKHTPQAPHFTYTPLVPSSTDYYVVKVTSFTLGDADVAAVQGVFDRGHGTLLDSGTTYMYLPTPAHQVCMGYCSC